MSALTLHLFGYPRLLRGGARVRLDRRKALGLLAHLALTGGASSRPELLALLWPELDRARARRALRRTLHELTQVAADGLTERVRDQLAIDPEVMSCDATEFLDASRPGAPSSELELARKLHRQPFLAGFSVRDARPFDEWQTLEAERLRARFVTVLEALIDRYSAEGRVGEALECARELLREDPYHEKAHRAVIELLRRQGRRAHALAHFESYERLVREDLGAEPAVELVDARTRLLSAPEASETMPPRTSPSRRPWRELTERLSVAAEALELSGQYEQGASLLEAALRAVGDDGPSAGALMIRRAMMDVSRGRFVAAQHGLERGLVRVREHGELDEVGFAYNRLGYVAYALGDRDAAFRALDRAVSIYRERDNVERLAWSLNVLGHLKIEAGTTSDARAHIEESLELASELGQRLRVGSALNSLGKLLLHDGKLEAAREVLEQGLRLRQGLGHRIGAADSMNNLGNVAAACGDTEEAITLYRGALAAAIEIQALPLLMEIFIGVAGLIGRRDAAEGSVGLLVLAGSHDACWWDAKRRATRILAAQRQRMGPRDFARAETEGRRWTVEEAAARIDRFAS